MRLPIVTVLLVMTLCACTGRRHARQDVGGRLSKISDALVASAVGRIEFFSIPDTSDYRIPVTATLLRTACDCELTLNAETYERKKLDLAQTMIDTESVQVSEQIEDVRTGVVFYTTHGDILSEIYFAKKGDLASIDGVVVRLRGPLRDKVRSLATLCEH